MSSLDPGLAQEVQMASRQIVVTKGLIERAKDWEERAELMRQLEQHEASLQAIQNKVRNSWGR